jgi:hypothetical protein
MPDRDLKLNSLSRFSKTSPRLVLEEYSHCEVPAGCGGVVLRWRKPNEPMTMWVKINSSAQTKSMTLDGENVLWKTRLGITWGTHVFAMSFQEANLSQGFLLFSAQLDDQFARILQPQGETEILSKPDGKWKYTLNKPLSDDWQLFNFEDAEWLPMVAKALPSKNSRGYDMSDFYQRTRNLGAEDLGVETKRGTGTVWVRRAFYIQPRSSNEE